MTEEQMRVAIAEHCGWVAVRLYHYNSTTTFPVGYSPKNPFPHDDGEEQVPDYPNDLNAMHEAEKSLDRKAENKFVRHLETIVARQTGANLWSWALLHATARQRAEAFLRTVGRYRD